MLRKTIQLSEASEDWHTNYIAYQRLERTLNAIDGNRFAKIREQYPTMQEDDICLCILTRLGLSNRTIGNIYCISVSAVQHRKLKLKKEVFGESSPDVTLEQILNRTA